MIDIHLLVTTLCDRDCKYCCNKQYDVQNLQYVADEELKDCRYLFLTGGEPFTYTNPNELARYYKEKYPNKEFKVWGVNWDLADFICKKCGNIVFSSRKDKSNESNN